jgi:hypothetical protein
VASCGMIFIPSFMKILHLIQNLLWRTVLGRSKGNMDLMIPYEDVSKSFRTGRLERELPLVQLSATTCSCTGIFWVSLVSFAAINLCVSSQRVFMVVVYFVMTQSGNFWIHLRSMG